MDNNTVLNIIKEFSNQEKNKYQIKRIGIFGSCARNIMSPESDVDVVVEVGDQDLFNLIGIKQELERRLHRHVDIVSYRDKMNPYLRRKIENEAIYV